MLVVAEKRSATCFLDVVGGLTLASCFFLHRLRYYYNKLLPHNYEAAIDVEKAAASCSRIYASIMTSTICYFGTTG